MSLINQMLQDLDRRGAQDDAPTQIDASIRTTARPPARKGLLLGIALLLAIGLGAWIWTRQVAPPPAAPAVLAEAKPQAPPAAAAPAPVPTAIPPVVAVADAQPIAPVSAPTGSGPAPAAAAAQPASLPVAERKPAATEKRTPPTPGDEAKPAANERNATVPSAPATRRNAASPAVSKELANAPDPKLPTKTTTPLQRSDNLLREGLNHLQAGRTTQAAASLRESLNENPGNSSAREALAALLLDAREFGQLEALLHDGLQRRSDPPLAMMLARLQVQANDLDAGLATLARHQPAVAADPDYHALYAALLHRAGRHSDAVGHYLAALRTDPARPAWLLGIGISLEAIGKPRDAVEAYQRARDSGALGAAQASFVEQRLTELR